MLDQIIRPFSGTAELILLTASKQSTVRFSGMMEFTLNLIELQVVHQVCQMTCITYHS